MNDFNEIFLGIHNGIDLFVVPGYLVDAAGIFPAFDIWGIQMLRISYVIRYAIIQIGSTTTAMIPLLLHASITEALLKSKLAMGIRFISNDTENDKAVVARIKTNQSLVLMLRRLSINRYRSIP